ncbi:DUF2157 domain-containing protein [Pontibacillus salicampi]|uniref:DUF2157 domain-containing protein n=1 Tax=Pontibacillus salicampi TaxID=1449801 RepID=A0ABV6LR02_9BACI
MRRDRLEKEAHRWVREGIISETQLQRIVSLYPKTDQRFLLMAFGGLFIGLGFLTFVASNWSDITNLMKMAIILISMLGFYGAGNWIHTNRSKGVGATFLVIGVLIFGAGIMLTGQMYHYMAFSATAFFIWSLAAIAMFMLSHEAVMLILAFAIMIVGQVYGGITYQHFHIGIGLLFIIGLGYFTLVHRREWISLLYSLGFVVQSLVLVFTTDLSYYWLLFFWLLLYALAEVMPSDFPVHSFQRVALLGGFILGIIHVFSLQSEWILDNLDEGIPFIISVLLVAMFIAYQKARKHDLVLLVDIALFIPVFFLPSLQSALVLLLLFTFSIGRLLVGYNRGDGEVINTGTVAFLASTLVAYFQLAWDFLDKSLFFFIGGILLFGLGYLLEQRRRSYAHNGEEEDLT